MGDGRERELGDRARAEYHALGRAAVLEVAELVALLDTVARRNFGVDHAGGDFGHADGHEGHQPDHRVVCFDENDRPRRDVRQVRLRFRGFDRVGAFGVGLGVIRAALADSPGGTRDWGVCTECGMGRAGREEMPVLLDLHREIVAARP